MTNDCKTCPVSTGTHKPAEAVHVQIDEPQAEALRLADECDESATHWVHEIDTRFKAAKMLRAQHARIADLEDDLQFVERWAVHHGSKPSISAEEALSCIQHYPAIHEITKSYKDGKRPDTFNPYARIAELEGQLDAIGAGGVEPLRKGFVRLTDVLARLEQGFGANSAPVTTIKRHFEMQAQPAQHAITTAACRAGSVYVSGPMTGYADWNFPAFNAAAAALRAQGLQVINPTDHGVVDGAEWADYLRTDLAQLAACERIHLLPGWSKSKGAKLELHVAQALGLQITLAEGAEPLGAAAPQEDAIAEIVSASHDSAEFGERGINFLRDFQHLEYGTKLYPAPAAPQAVQAAVPMFWVRLLRDGLYEGPVHNNSVGGKMLRDEKPGEWHPLYLHAAPAHPAEGLPAQIETLRSELAEEKEAADNWRRLAMQFDNHRMQAIGHLKAVTNPDACFDKYKAAKEFLNAPPLDGEAVLAQRIAALAATHPTQQGLDAQDAARYRWLRERDLETVHKGGVFAGMTPENYVINGVDLDAAIDAAIAAQAKQGEKP